MKDGLLKFLLFASGTGFGFLLSEITSTPASGVFSVDSVAEKMETRIDSGKAEIMKSDEVREKLKQEYWRLGETGNKYIDSVISLPLDSELLFFKTKIRIYAEDYKK